MCRYTLNHYYKAVVRKTFPVAKGKYVWQLVPDVHSLEMDTGPNKDDHYANYLREAVRHLVTGDDPRFMMFKYAASPREIHV